MKKSNAILILLILLFLTIGVVSLLYFYITTIDIREVEMDLKVGNRIGINVGSDKIWFGMVTPGGSATRNIILTNDYPFPVLVKLMIYGDLKSYVSLSESNVVLEPNTKKEVSVTVFVPSDMRYGNYTGTLKAVFKKRI